MIRAKLQSIVLISVLLCLAFLFPLLYSVSANAGATKVYVSSVSSISETGINEGDFLLSGGVHGERGKAVFDENCSNTAKLIGKARINNLKNYGLQTLFRCTATLNIIEFGENGKLSFCFGLGSLRDSAGAEGSLEIAFSQGERGVLVEVSEYFEEDVASPVFSQEFAATIELGKAFVLEAEMGVDGTFDLSVGGRKAIESRRLVTVAEGYSGIISIGRNTAELSDTEIYGYQYEAPENVDYTEDFSQNGYNANMFYSQSTASALRPSSLSVSDGQLVFRNTATAYFSTRYMYSNFILEFDITHLQREAEFGENGTPTALISNWFGIAFGVNNIELSADETVTQADWLNLEGFPVYPTADHTQPYSGARYVLYDQGSSVRIQGMSETGGLALWDKDAWNEEEECINLRFTVLDGVVSLYLKKSGDASFGDACFTYDLGASRVGYVRIFTWGPTGTPPEGLNYVAAANFSIDNFSITNADFEGVRNVIETPAYETNLVAETPDFDYDTAPDESDLIGNKIESGAVDGEQPGTGCGGTVAGLSVAGGIVCCAVSAAAIRRGKHE